MNLNETHRERDDKIQGIDVTCRDVTNKNKDSVNKT